VKTALEGEAAPERGNSRGEYERRLLGRGSWWKNWMPGGEKHHPEKHGAWGKGKEGGFVLGEKDLNRSYENCLAVIGSLHGLDEERLKKRKKEEGGRNH